MEQVAELARRVSSSVQTVIKGKPEVVDLVVVALLAEGHVLIEDVPGVGKTSIARALARSVDASWSRIQFTPDLLPSDVTGGEIYREHEGTFEYQPGPVFAHIVVADEINRASPKTQSALLEVMEERSVTVGNSTHRLPRPFLVVATQNPVEMEGTYRLPEAQLDRFLMKVTVGYPDIAAEVEVLAEDGAGGGIDTMAPVTTTDEVAAAADAAARIAVAPVLQHYVASLAAATRTLPEVRLGASPRGSLALMRAARVRAAIAGRDYATADDVKSLATAVLAHRLVLAPQAALTNLTPADVIHDVLQRTPVPTSSA